MKTGIWQAVIMLGFFCGVVSAAENAPGVEEKKLGVTLDFTYTSKWLSKGIEAYRSHGGFFETVDLDFYETGFGVRVTHRSATGSGFVDMQRLDYRPYYKGTLFEDQPYKTDFDLSVGYEHYYGLARTKANTTYEWVGCFAWPKLLVENLVPKYIAYYEYPESGQGINRKNVGWVHSFILDYSMKVPQLPSPLKLSSEIAYYDGLANRPSSWAYATWGLSTKFNVNKSTSLVPGVYYQHSMDDDLNPGRKRDILYTMMSMKYTF